jgi:hypothetical protein
MDGAGRDFIKGASLRRVCLQKLRTTTRNLSYEGLAPDRNCLNTKLEYQPLCSNIRHKRLGEQETHLPSSLT